MKRYKDLNTELRRIFGKKVIKLSLNGNFSCPNRENSTGCIFCSEKGSGEFSASPTLSITDQIKSQIQFQYKKWPDALYIAYFGTNTSTYADLTYLKMIFEEALAFDGVVGLAIATRPDCIDDKVLDLLKELNEKTYLWIELGLQTIHNKTHVLINTRYDYNIFLDTFEGLKANNIKSVVHLISNLPGESNEMIKESVEKISKLKPWGIKLHMLYILKNTELSKLYETQPFYIYSKEEYVSLVISLLEILDKNIIIHRLTGDPPRKDLLLPLWTINKRSVLQSIEKEMVIQNKYQGNYVLGGPQCI